MNTEDLFYLAINAYHEARGESDEGVKAVCHVVMNRSGAQLKMVRAVVLAPMQFSWANGGARPPIKEYDALLRCFALADESIKERIAGIVFPADHYYASSISAPYWAKSMKMVATIGNHIFLKS